MFASRIGLFRPVYMTQKRMMSLKTKSLFHLPKMNVHERGYNLFFGDVPHKRMLGMTQYIVYSTNCYDIASVFQKYPEDLTVKQLAHAFNVIGKIFINII